MHDIVQVLPTEEQPRQLSLTAEPKGLSLRKKQTTNPAILSQQTASCSTEQAYILTTGRANDKLNSLTDQIDSDPPSL